MAKLTSHSATSSRFQITLEFNRPLASVGYSNMGREGPAMSLRFDADDEAHMPSGERKAKLRDRTAALTLDESDLTKVLRRLTMPNIDMGLFMGGDFSRLNNDAPTRLFMRVCEACGLSFNRYRYRAGKDFVYCVAITPEHALHILKRTCRHDIDASQLERGDMAGDLIHWKGTGQ